MKRGTVFGVLAVVVLGASALMYVEISASQPSCNFAPTGSVLYVRIAHDGGSAAAANATVDASPIEACNGSSITISILYRPPVNASGIAVLDLSGETGYSITVHYAGQSFPFTADYHGSLKTCAKLSVPSGSLSVTAC